MEAQTDTHLNRFLGSFARFEAYFLLPATVDGKGAPHFLTDLAILKHKLTVKESSEVGDNDLEAILLPKNRPRHERD
jgi:hypothetical protein